MAGMWRKLPQGMALVGFGFLLAVPGVVAQTDGQGARPEARDRAAPAPPGPYRSGSTGQGEVWNKRSRGGYPYQQMQQRRLGYPQGSRGRGGMDMGMHMGSGSRGGGGYGGNVPPPPPSGAPQQDTNAGAASQAQDRQSGGFGGSATSESRREGPGDRYRGGNRRSFRGESERGQQRPRQRPVPRGGGTTTNRDQYRPGVDQAEQRRRQPQYGPSYGRHEAPEYPPDQQRPERGGQP